VRSFFVHNALYWIEEFNFDGLRLDAVQAIKDTSNKHILVEIAEGVANTQGRTDSHLVLENDDNAAWLLARDPSGRPRPYTAQWNDDLHHALHVLITAKRTDTISTMRMIPAGTSGAPLPRASPIKGSPRDIGKAGPRHGEQGSSLGGFRLFSSKSRPGGKPLRGDRIASIAPHRRSKRPRRSCCFLQLRRSFSWVRSGEAVSLFSSSATSSRLWPERCGQAGGPEFEEFFAAAAAVLQQHRRTRPLWRPSSRAC